MRQPDFFIIGAPKCGTTALSEYLRSHPRIYFSVPKEPHYYCTDFSERFRTIYSKEQYAECFQGADERHLAVGEGSVWYLFSDAAVPSILASHPEAKFVVMVRNPLDMVRSFHAQAVFSRDETIEDFETAWRMQNRRAEGRGIPPTCREPRILQYRKVASLGWQYGRLLRCVSRRQVMAIVFDDLVGDPSAVYHDVLSHLGVPVDSRDSFPRINESRAHRSKLIGNFLQRPPRALVEVALKARNAIGIERLGVLDYLTRVNTRRAKLQPLSIRMHEELVTAFRDDVLLLSQLIGRDLTHWLGGNGDRGDAGQ